MKMDEIIDENKDLEKQNKLLRERLERVEQELQSAVNILDPEQVRIAKINVKILQHG
jgi:regulator of replication initiation timing